MENTRSAFRARAVQALGDATLRQALDQAREGFVAKRAARFAELPELEGLRDAAAALKDRVLDRLDEHLERYEAAVVAAGGQVHRARDAAEARAIVLAICKAAGARRITKGKSMVSEEIGLNDALVAAGLDLVETDLGEYIIQLAGETPSHIIAPAVHKTREQVADLFARSHGGPRKSTIAELVGEARHVLRERYFQADVGITGANILIAETGSSLIVTNEGNGDLTQTLAPVHIVTAGIERVVPTLEDATLVLRLLARSATGQETTAYTTFSTGPRRPEDLDGPTAYHVVLLDNGRSRMRDGPYRAMLRCIRCGACLNHCPVYGAIGGHAYGWVYPGPMGSVLTPLIKGLDTAYDLPNACTLNGRCAAVCPVKIPLPELLRHLRHQQHLAAISPPRQRAALVLWRAAATRPWLYHALERLGARLLAWLGGRAGRIRHLPGARGWTAERDLPAPTGHTFLELARRQGLTHGHDRRAVSDEHATMPAVDRAVCADAGCSNAPHPRLWFDEDPSVRFIAHFKGHAGTLERLSSRAEIPAAVERLRVAWGLPARAAVGADLGALSWPAGWDIHHGPAGISETLAVTPAFAGIAETGTLMLIAAPGSPTTHNFVPDNQILVLEMDRILRHPEDAWAMLRRREGGMPRAVNLVSGPSRTADIEQTIQLGAHGPGRLHLLLIDRSMADGDRSG
ncbi:MAG: 4Fe-4S dicluster domain-containing protein [Sphingobacteriia bacterium]|nr:4Fe-4S dicluster domain-containing protein [Sphingobacteriia bacterium]NCC39993.1 4Fe-4S dicluster domain-containing protein [Gammaproteobacteria bacterium]